MRSSASPENRYVTSPSTAVSVPGCVVTRRTSLWAGNTSMISVLSEHFAMLRCCPWSGNPGGKASTFFALPAIRTSSRASAVRRKSNSFAMKSGKYCGSVDVAPMGAMCEKGLDSRSLRSSTSMLTWRPVMSTNAARARTRPCSSRSSTGFPRSICRYSWSPFPVTSNRGFVSAASARSS